MLSKRLCDLCEKEFFASVHAKFTNLIFLSAQLFCFWLFLQQLNYSQLGFPHQILLKLILIYLFLRLQLHQQLPHPFVGQSILPGFFSVIGLLPHEVRQSVSHGAVAIVNQAAGRCRLVPLRRRALYRRGRRLPDQQTEIGVNLAGQPDFATVKMQQPGAIGIRAGGP